MNKGLLIVSFSIIFAISTCTYAGTRDLVFDDEEDNASQKTTTQTEVTGSSKIETLAIKTTVELTRDGQTSTVNPNAEFQSGDKVKLKFTSNTDGYVYWLARGSSGKYTVLYPNEKAGINNEVKRNEEYTVPVKGSFKFDSTPGDEEVLCILSTEKIPEIDKEAANQFQDTTALNNLQTEQQAKRSGSTRDLVFDDEDEENVNTASQTGPKGEPFVVKYTLKHK